MPFGPFLMESGGLSDGRRPQSRYASSEKSQSSSSTEPEDLGLRFPVRPASKLLCGSENVSMSLHSLSSARSDSPPLSVADRPLSLNVPVGRSATLEVRSASAPDHNCADVVTSQPQPVRKESLMSAESTGQQSAAELVKLDPGGDLYVLPKYSRPPKVRNYLNCLTRTLHCGHSAPLSHSSSLSASLQGRQL